jgi:hypothetical protein
MSRRDMNYLALHGVLLILAGGEGPTAGVICDVKDGPYGRPAVRSCLPSQELLSCELIAFPAALIS